MPCRGKILDESSRLDVVKIARVPACFPTCFLPGRAKDYQHLGISGANRTPPVQHNSSRAPWPRDACTTCHRRTQLQTVILRLRSLIKTRTPRRLPASRQHKPAKCEDASELLLACLHRLFLDVTQCSLAINFHEATAIITLSSEVIGERNVTHGQRRRPCSSVSINAH